jgi:hypothetical protein
MCSGWSAEKPHHEVSAKKSCGMHRLEVSG